MTLIKKSILSIIFKFGDAVTILFIERPEVLFTICRFGYVTDKHRLILK